jgi:DNA-binding transcriptional LysR family regulator
MRTIDLDSLDIFRTVVKEGGVIRAAHKLNRVQSNVTTRIRQLEERLGQKLFHRHGRSLVLSPEGTLLLSYAERLFRLADEAEHQVRGGPPLGVLRIGSLESTAGSRLPTVLSRFHKQYPGVVVELVTGTSAALVAKVANYEIEAAFVSQPFTAPTLNSKRMFEEELTLITSRHNPPIAKPSDLSGQTLIAFASGCSYRKCMEDWLIAGGVVPARTLEFGSYQAIIACVAAGTGFAMVPKSLLAGLKAGGEVRQHALPAKTRKNVTHLVWSGTASLALGRLMEMAGPLK